MARVVVIGGGYAGVIAANRLRLRPDLDITLVNPRARFVERIRLHQLLTGSDGGGRAAATVKESVCRSTVGPLRREARNPGSLFWIMRGRG